MRTCVFVGPSAGDVALPGEFDRYAPAALGALWRAVEAGYERVALVDGLFGGVPSVWHKEILYALTHGVRVLGASSMGALRAAELSRYGMVGVGVVYRLYRSGLLSDDDEVCLLHAPRERGFQPLTLPMVSLRRTLGQMARAGEIGRGVAASVCRAMKQLHFTRRTREGLAGAFRAAGDDGARALAAFERRHVDLKTRDYASLVRALAAPPPPAPAPPPWADLETHKWRMQFVDQARDIPPLDPW